MIEAVDATTRHIHPALEGSRWLQKLATRRALFTAEELFDVTLQIADQTDLWQPLVRHTTESRWYEALVLSAALELWLIGWMPSQATSIHAYSPAGLEMRLYGPQAAPRRVTGSPGGVAS